MAYSQGKFFGNMLFMTDKYWYDTVSPMPNNLISWLAYEVDDRMPNIPYKVWHESIPDNVKCIQIIPDIERVKILQQAKDSSLTSWDKFYHQDVKNWKLHPSPLYSFSQLSLQDWNLVERHLVLCELIFDLNIDYRLARKYFDAYWQAHNNLF